jgi:UDP-glucuronate decarboxylase
VTGPINIGNPGEFSSLQLATMVVDMTGSRVPYRSSATAANDQRQRRPDISRAQEPLSWQPRTPLKEGLIRTIAYFEKLLSDNSVRDSLAAELQRRTEVEVVL